MRRRYVYREVEPGRVEAFEVGADYSDAPKSTGDLGKFEYDNTRAPDGTDISSRTKLNRYLKETGQCLVHELKGDIEAAQRRREAVARGEKSPGEKRAQLERFGRAAYRKGLLR